jgi:hypothetical protein
VFGDCCLKIKRGFMADMIQLAAITELRKFYDETMVRSSNKYLGYTIDQLNFLDPSKECVDIRTGKPLDTNNDVVMYLPPLPNKKRKS